MWKWAKLDFFSFFFCSQNGRRRPFWMTENHFWSHLSPFQINMQLLYFLNFFTKWPLAAIFDDRKSLSIASLAITGQYTTIILFFSQNGPAAILDDWKSLLIAYLAISDKYTTFLFFDILSQNGIWGPFWMTETHFWSHLSPFQINMQLLFFWIFFHKMAAGGHFGWPKITFDLISRHFRSICNFYFFGFFFTKWPPAAILDDRKSLLISSLAISDQYATFIFFEIFYKMAAGRHFWWPKITFDRISRNYRSIRNFFFQNGCQRPF